MVFFLVSLILSNCTYAQEGQVGDTVIAQPEQVYFVGDTAMFKTNDRTVIKSYCNKDCCEVRESYNTERKIVRWRRYYDDSGKNFMDEKYRSSDGSLWVNVYYDERETKYCEEFFNKYEIREKTKFYCSGRICEETYNLFGKLIKKAFYNLYESSKVPYKVEEGENVEPCLGEFIRRP
jgi:hypothetical protein